MSDSFQRSGSGFYRRSPGGFRNTGPVDSIYRLACAFEPFYGFTEFDPAQGFDRDEPHFKSESFPRLYTTFTSSWTNSDGHTGSHTVTYLPEGSDFILGNAGTPQERMQPVAAVTVDTGVPLSYAPIEAPVNTETFFDVAMAGGGHYTATLSDPLNYSAAVARCMATLGLVSIPTVDYGTSGMAPTASGPTALYSAWSDPNDHRPIKFGGTQDFQLECCAKGKPLIDSGFGGILGCVYGVVGDYNTCLGGAGELTRCAVYCSKSLWTIRRTLPAFGSPVGNSPFNSFAPPTGGSYRDNLYQRLYTLSGSTISLPAPTLFQALQLPQTIAFDPATIFGTGYGEVGFRSTPL